jgi:hypothetical protein
MDWTLIDLVVRPPHNGAATNDPADDGVHVHRPEDLLRRNENASRKDAGHSAGLYKGVNRGHKRQPCLATWPEILRTRNDGLAKSDGGLSKFEGKSGQMEAAYLEKTSEATEAIVERQELRNKEMNIDAVGPLEDRHMDQRSAVQCRRMVKKQTQRYWAFQQKLATSPEGRYDALSLHPCTAKQTYSQRPGRNNAARGTPKRPTLRKKQQTRQECKSGIKGRGARCRYGKGRKRHPT